MEENMRFENYINEGILVEAVFQKYLKKLSNKPANTAEKTLKNNWIKLANILKSNQLENDALDIINKHLNTKYTSLDQISKMQIASMPNEGVLVEDFKHFWNLIKIEGFPILSFYPMLQVWLELDKLIKGSGADYTAMGVYGLFWALLVSGKFIKGWSKWKKENPEEYEKEGKKDNPFSLGKLPPLKKKKYNKVYDKEW